jgi:hypothetical protein
MIRDFPNRMPHLDTWFYRPKEGFDFLPDLFVSYKDYELHETTMSYLALHMLLMPKPLSLLSDMMRQWLV